MMEGEMGIKLGMPIIYGNNNKANKCFIFEDAKHTRHMGNGDFLMKM